MTQDEAIFILMGFGGSRGQEASSSITSRQRRARGPVWTGPVVKSSSWHKEWSCTSVSVRVLHYVRCRCTKYWCRCRKPYLCTDSYVFSGCGRMVRRLLLDISLGGFLENIPVYFIRNFEYNYRKIYWVLRSYVLNIKNIRVNYRYGEFHQNLWFTCRAFPC